MALILSTANGDTVNTANGDNRMSVVAGVRKASQYARDDSISGLGGPLMHPFWPRQADGAVGVGVLRYGGASRGSPSRHRCGLRGVMLACAGQAGAQNGSAGAFGEPMPRPGMTIN